MAGIVSEESAVGRSLEGISSGQHSQSGHALAEWRSSEQVENGIPSTSPPYWDTDDSDDDDDGPKPSELYGKYTWKIEKFSEINKRELRSNAFEVGGYKWYILIYPQGCDVCNHLSLFLCVANHDKLLPGWSHFAQFTIAVVNKDPKKSKYSDTLHRFWKKEHDWGWKKFMELSKVSDGFIDADTLIIKAQVQVIREKQDHPFRCLDCQYRRELVRVYLSNVEQICRRYVEDRRGKLGKLIEDKARWSSFCAFWLSMDQNARRRMSREKKDVILKVIVKQFFIEKEVTSTLVMDSLYSGLKALEGQSKCKNDEDKLPDGEDIPPPFVYVEKGTFLLVDDLMLLLERAAMEPLPPKDEKGPQNRTKDGAAGEDFNKDSIERDERRLTELGRRTVEIFVLAHIFSNKIEVAYQEAIALKRQEELIREEEAAWLVESEQKAKRGTADKEKKSKKKQGKQKRNNRKGKDKAKDEKSTIPVQVQLLHESPNDDRKDPFESQSVPEKHSNLEDVSDMSDSVECTPDMVQQDSEERDASPVNWDTDTSDFQPPAEASSVSTVDNGADKRSSSVIDDSCSTCSTDSAPSVVINGLYKGNSFSNYKCQRSPKRGNNRRGKMASEETSEAESRTTDPAADMALNGDVSPSGKTAEAGDSVAAVSSLSDQTKWPDLNTVKKEDKAVLPQKEPSIKDQANLESPSKDKIASPKSPPRSPTSPAISKPDTHCVKTSSNGPQQINRATKTATSEPVDKLSGLQVQAQPRLRLSGTRPAATVASVVQPAPTVTAPGWAGPDRPPVSHGYVTPSYRNAIMGNSFNPSSASLSSRAVNALPSFSQQPSSAPARAPVPGFIPNGSETVGPNLATSGFSFNTVRPQRDASRSLNFDVRNFDPYQPMNGGSHELFPSDLPRTSGRPAQGGVGDEFPHLDIINDLLDDEQSTVFQGLSNGPAHLNRQLTYPTSMSLSGEVGSLFSSCRFERSRSYPDDGFQHDYYNSTRDYIPQANMSPYANGQMDELVPTQWQINGPDLPLLSMRGSGVDGYGYSMPDYSNLACRVSGYNMFWPSNGH